MMMIQSSDVEQKVDDAEQGVDHCRRLAGGLQSRNCCSAQGAKRGGSASARMIENIAARRSIRRAAPQPPARSRTRAPRWPYLWLFSVWMVAPRRSEKLRPREVKATSRIASRCISMRAEDVVPARLVAEGVDRDVAVQLAVDACEQVEVEGGGDAGRVVIGGDQPVDGLHPVHADQQLRADAEQVCGSARSRSIAVRGTKLPIVEPGRSRAWACPRCSAGSSNGRAKSASTGGRQIAGIGAAMSAALSRRKSPEMSTGT